MATLTLARPAPAITCAGTREPRGQGRSPRGLQGWVTRAAGGAAGSARPGAAPRGAAPPGGCSPRPATPAGARLPRLQARDPAGRGAGLSLSIHRHPAAGRRRRRRLENSGEPAPGAGAGAEGPLPLGPAVIAGAARLGAHPGPFPAGARAEAGEARQHPLARPPVRAPSRAEPSPGAAHGTTCADSTQWMLSQVSHQERPEEPPSLCPQNTCQLCQDTRSTDKTDPQLCASRGVLEMSEVHTVAWTTLLLPLFQPH
ncbi:circumsporozoite protein [Manis pentadactyla]|uniref:circumsporozoite protein n=1 Tax=Manis pentadactyla TaxID=143292 RepID=UPI00255CCDF5|nr:circumsporozoite protein [Manis pentadactyla]